MSDTTIQWSHSEINVTLPEGQGGPYDLVLTVGDHHQEQGTFHCLICLQTGFNSTGIGANCRWSKCKIIGDNFGCSDTGNSMKLCGGGHVTTSAVQYLL